MADPDIINDSPVAGAALQDDSVDQSDDAKVARKKIPLVELFGPTIQGEGSVIGQQTYFLRFGLCDYLCAMCDSLHAVLPQQVRANAEWLQQEEIFKKVLQHRKPNSTKWITYSGGNPLIHDLTMLTTLLKSSGWKINVETQGTLFKDWLDKVDSITISPKGPGMGEVTHIDVLDQFVYQVKHGRATNEFPLPNDPAYGTIQPDTVFKIVVFDQRDLDFAAEIFERYQKYIPLDHCYLSLGNPRPPDPLFDSGEPTQADVWEWKQGLIDQYKLLFEDIATHPILSQVKFLPQWHVFAWGNGQGH